MNYSNEKSPIIEEKFCENRDYGSEKGHYNLVFGTNSRHDEI